MQEAKQSPCKKVLFLDIDGVINCSRTAFAFNGYPWDLDVVNLRKFDSVAIAAIRKICRLGDIGIVLSSSWRLHFSCFEISNAFDLPVFDCTSARLSNRKRGYEIKEWLDEHPGVEKYCIVDDIPDMLDDQLLNFVQTDEDNGLSWSNILHISEILGVDIWKKEED